LNDILIIIEHLTKKFSMKNFSKILLLLLFQACLCCNAQSREVTIARGDFSKYHHLSTVFHTKSALSCNILNSHVVAWKTSDSADFILHKTRNFYRQNTLDSICLDTVFSYEDSVFMVEQFKSQINSEGIWIGYGKMKILSSKNFHKKGKEKPYWEFSEPIFSKDLQKCLIKINYFYSKFRYVFKTILVVKSRDGTWEEKAVVTAIHSFQP
jgi:hypothetical protein